MRSRRTIPLALAALSYVLALVQRPGQVVADTKVHLYLDPARFLRDVVSLWTGAPDLGHVGQLQHSPCGNNRRIRNRLDAVISAVDPDEDLRPPGIDRACGRHRILLLQRRNDIPRRHAERCEFGV